MKSDIHPYTWYNPTKGELKAARIVSPVAFDLDSVLNDMGEPMGEYIAKTYDVDYDEVHGLAPGGYRTFHFDVPGVSSNDISALVQKYVLEESPSLLATPFMSEVIDYVYDVTDEPITVVTARPQEAMDVTYDWLCQNLSTFLPFNLIMVNGMTKLHVLKKIYCEIFVDDRAKTIEGLTDNINLSVLYSRPWNQGRPVEPGDLTVRDLRDLIPIINYMYKRPTMMWPGTIPYPDRIGRGKVADLYA